MFYEHETAVLKRFIRDLKQAPSELKKMAEKETPFDYETRINIDRLQPGLGSIIVRGDILYRGFPTVYGIPSLNVYVADYKGARAFSIDDTYRLSLDTLLGRLRGSEVEVDVTMASDIGLAGDRFWDDWMKKPAGQEYNLRIYPAVGNLLLRIASISKFQHIEWVDLFGGDGTFVIRNLSDIEKLSNSYKCHIVDLNEPSLFTARCLLEGFAHVKVHPPTDLTKQEPIFEGVSEAPNIVTALGGLCREVIRRDDALKIAGKVHHEMADGGFFVLTGYSPLLLNREDFTKIGFRVRNMSVPPNVLQFIRPFQLYILQKSEPKSL